VEGTARLSQVTRLLSALGQGQRSAMDELLPLVYDELHELATSAMRHARPGHTLQPTAVVHEAYARLVGSDGSVFESRDHFLAVAARAMRSVLVDHARRRGSLKRRGPGERVELTDTVAGYEERGLDLLAVEEALQRLATFDPDLVRVVELLYFAGLTLDQLHNDSTTVSFFGSYDDAVAGAIQRGKPTLAITHGHSKDHRPDLKQLLFILAVARDGGVPIYSEGRPCRRPCARRIIDLLQNIQRHELSGGGFEPQTMVTDLSAIQRQVLKLLKVPSRTYGRKVSN